MGDRSTVSLVTGSVSRTDRVGTPAGCGVDECPTDETGQRTVRLRERTAQKAGTVETTWGQFPNSGGDRRVEDTLDPTVTNAVWKLPPSRLDGPGFLRCALT